METRTFGTTGLVVTRLGLGLAALGRPGYINLGHADDLRHDYDVAAMEARAHAVLDAAWAAGVRYFDAARSYGEAERFLASWLAARAIRPGEVTVASKWGQTYTAGWKVEADKHEVKDHTLPVLRRQSAESRALLGAHLAVYQIHSATRESGVLDDAEVLGELARLREGGWKVGLSLTGPRQADTLRQALGLSVAGRRLFDVVQATWNVLEPSAGPALEDAHAAGLGVVVKEALANGRLTPRNADPAFAAKRAVLTQPWADVVLSGAATEEQVRSNASALAVRWGAEAAQALRGLAEPAEAYWRARGGLPWN
jgi:aryl-alcohol dehydrogenase-like predicted oxidoreductase